MIDNEVHDPPVFSEMGADSNLTDQMENMALVSIPCFSLIQIIRLKVKKRKIVFR